MVSSSQLLFFISIISLCILQGVSGKKFVNFSTSVSVGLYAVTVLIYSPILLIFFSRKNVAKSSASFSSVLHGGIGFSIIFPDS